MGQSWAVGQGSAGLAPQIVGCTRGRWQRVRAYLSTFCFSFILVRGVIELYLRVPLPLSHILRLLFLMTHRALFLLDSVLIGSESPIARFCRAKYLSSASLHGGVCGAHGRTTQISNWVVVGVVPAAPRPRRALE